MAIPLVTTLFSILVMVIGVVAVVLTTPEHKKADRAPLLVGLFFVPMFGMLLYVATHV